LTWAWVTTVGWQLFKLHRSKRASCRQKTFRSPGMATSGR
jgi:hypothetical protein